MQVNEVGLFRSAPAEVFDYAAPVITSVQPTTVASSGTQVGGNSARDHSL